jgi:23S rRNA pseudouridine2605 synthase
LNADQLKAERATRWRQNANPLLTADDAQEWIASAGLCLLLPRRQFLAPAPSFVEACTGTPTELPTREAIENAMGLVHRLAEQNTVLPLNLFGTPTDQPDFLAAREVFPHIYSLVGTRDWKTVPSSKSTPLIIEIWKQLQEEGSLTAAELQTALGREVTEAAVLRGLIEMWSGLRVIPVYESGKATRWELIQHRFKDALTAAGRLSQTAALSALVSLYLESVLAASTDEIETFLSPLTSRSRVREAVNGLTATRQLDIVPVGSQAMLYISGSLPEFGEPEIESQPQEITLKPRSYDREPRTFDRERKPPTRKPFERKPFERKSGDGERGGPRKFERPSRPGFKRAGGDRFAARPRPDTGSDRERPSDGAPRSRPAFRSGERPERGPQRSFGGGSKFPAKKFGTRSGPSKFGSGPARPGSGPKKFGTRSDAGPSRPWQKRTEGGEEKGFPRNPGFRPRRDDAGERPRPPRREDGGERRSEGFSSRPKFGAPKKFGAKPGFGPRTGESRSSGPRPGGSKFGAPRSGAPRSSASGFDRKPGFGGKPGFDRKPGGERSRPDEGGKRPFFRKRPDQDASAESRPPRREGSWSKSGPPRAGSPRTGSTDRPSGGRSGFSGPRSAPRSDSAPGSGPRRTGSSWAAKKSAPGSGFKRTSSSKPGFSKSGPGKGGFGKSASGSRSGSSKPAFGKGGFDKRKSGGFGDRKPGGFGKKPGGFAPRKPGGARPPFKKRKPEGDKGGE